MLCQHCLPALFRCDQSCMEYVDEHLKDIDASPGKEHCVGVSCGCVLWVCLVGVEMTVCVGIMIDGKTGAHLACLRTAKVESKLFSRSLESTDSIFQSSMHHSEEQVSLRGRG